MDSIQDQQTELNRLLGRNAGRRTEVRSTVCECGVDGKTCIYDLFSVLESEGGDARRTKVPLTVYPDEALLLGSGLGHVICGGRCGRTASGVLRYSIIPKVEFVDEV